MENEWVSRLIDEGVGLSFPTEFARALRLFSGLCSVGALRVWWQALASRRDEDFRMRILSDSAVRSSLAVPVPLVGYMDSLRLGHGFYTSFSSWPSRSDGVQVMEVERGPSLALPVSSPYGSTFSGPVELTHHEDFAIAKSGLSAGPAFAQVSHGFCLAVQRFELSEHAIEPWHSRCSADVVPSPAGVDAMPAHALTPECTTAVNFQPGDDKAVLDFEPRFFRIRSIQDGLEQAFESTCDSPDKSFYCPIVLGLTAAGNGVSEPSPETPAGFEIPTGQDQPMSSLEGHPGFQVGLKEITSAYSWTHPPEIALTLPESPSDDDFAKICSLEAVPPFSLPAELSPEDDLSVSGPR